MICKRHLLMVILLAFVGLLNAQQKPNIIYILADDLGYGDVGFNGGKKIATPAIDKLAAEGIIFSNHYAGSPVCGPSRSCLMHGLHTGHAPVRENPAWTASGKPVDMKLEDVTVAEELKRAGYTNGIIGKWGLAENLDEGMPLNQGFDYFYGFAQHKPAHHYYPETIWENDQLIQIEGNVRQEKKGTYSEDLFIDKALGFINENHEKPFFLYFAPTIPHYELTIPEEYKKEYYAKNWPLRKMKPGHYLHDENGFVTYAAMVSRLDMDVARIMELLKKLGIDDNTLVIFTSDNGHEFDNVKEEFMNSNGPHKGKKRDVYEGGVHVPFASRWPGKVPAGTTSDHVSAFWDFLPTACEIAGIEPSATTDGISYLTALLGDDLKQPIHDYLYWEFNEKRGPMQAILKDYYKLVKYYGKQPELYDLSVDPGEEHNIADVDPDKCKELEVLLKTTRTENAEFPLEPHSSLAK